VRRAFPAGGWGLRLVIFLGPLVALMAGSPQGRTPQPWIAVVVGILSFTSASMPEHYIGSLVLTIVVAWWVIEVRGGLPLSAVAAAAALLAAHVAGTVAAYGPPQLVPDAAVVRLWSRRAVLLWLTAPLTWLVVDAEAGRATAASYWVLGLAVGLVLIVLATMSYPSQGDRRL
jgi:hypothetical protein